MGDSFLFRTFSTSTPLVTVRKCDCQLSAFTVRFLVEAQVFFSSNENWMWCVVMEMYLIDRLAISLERLYTAVPSVLLNLFEFTWVRLKIVTFTTYPS